MVDKLVKLEYMEEVVKREQVGKEDLHVHGTLSKLC
jgi:hypothetical protein